MQLFRVSALYLYIQLVYGALDCREAYYLSFFPRFCVNLSLFLQKFDNRCDGNDENSGIEYGLREPLSF